MNNMLNDFKLQSQLIEIYKSFPSIFKYEQVSVCSKVYYPIAIIDLLIEEHVRQPFSSVEQIIIELIHAGKTSVVLLAEAIGLPELYIADIVRQLEEEGVINHFKLTSKGEYGRLHKIKHTTASYKQSLQFDPILNLVLSEQEIDVKYLVPVQDTDAGRTHFLPNSHINLDLLHPFFEVKPNEKMKVTSKQIKEVLNVKLYYVEAISLQFNLVPHPYIFFPNESGICKSLIFMSEANLDYISEKVANLLLVDQSCYYQIWLFVKQIKDELKKKQDNHILKRDVKVKISQHIEFCNEHYILMTDSGLKLTFEFNQPFTLTHKHYDAIQSLEWSRRHIPYLVLEDIEEYSSFIGYSECYEQDVYESARLIFELEQSFENPNELFIMLQKLIEKRTTSSITIAQLFELLTLIQAEQLKKSKRL